jgi:hypothetical protein
MSHACSDFITDPDPARAGPGRQWTALIPSRISVVATSA